jgi:hypothetical protein
MAATLDLSDLFTNEDIDYEADQSDLIDDEIDDAFFETPEIQEAYHLTTLTDDEDD